MHISGECGEDTIGVNCRVIRAVNDSKVCICK